MTTFMFTHPSLSGPFPVFATDKRQAYFDAQRFVNETLGLSPNECQTLALRTFVPKIGATIRLASNDND